MQNTHPQTQHFPSFALRHIVYPSDRMNQMLAHQKNNRFQFVIRRFLIMRCFFLLLLHSRYFVTKENATKMFQCFNASIS